MSERRYLILTKEDAMVLASAIADGRASTETLRIATRLREDTGGNIEEIADDLKRAETCPACSIEGQESSCVAIDARATGRRIARLLERARGERAPGTVRL